MLEKAILCSSPSSLLLLFLSSPSLNCSRNLIAGLVEAKRWTDDFKPPTRSCLSVPDSSFTPSYQNLIFPTLWLQGGWRAGPGPCPPQLDIL